MTFGNTFPAAATSSGTGTVTYLVTNQNGTGCSLAGSTVSFTGVGTGPCVVTASVVANGNYWRIRTLSITVNPASRSTTTSMAPRP